MEKSFFSEPNGYSKQSFIFIVGVGGKKEEKRVQFLIV